MTPAELIAGVGLAAGAAACFDGAVALQALEARAVPPEGGGGRLLAALVRRPRWLAATGLSIAGWPLQVAALTLAPLTVVQPTLALGLVLLLVLGVRLLHEPADRGDLVAAAAIAAGVAVLAWAAPEPEHAGRPGPGLIAVLGGLALLAAGAWPARSRLRAGWVLVVAAGCGFAAAGLTTKLLADALADGRAGAAVGWAAASGAAALFGLGDEMAALQRVGAARVAAGAFALQVAVPVACAPLLTGENWGATPLGGAVVAVGLVLVLGGSARLGTARAVTGLVTASRR